MATISLTLPADGQTIDASDVNNPFNTIAAEINGNLDNSNIKAGAAIDRSKIAGFTDGWESLNYSPSTVAYNGNRSYDLTFSTVNLTTNISNGMRLKLARSVTPPTQCTSLSGSTQYYSKSSPSGMTFTDDFTVSAWIKPTSYTGNPTIASRYNGTSGWLMGLDTDGRVYLAGYNGGAGNISYVKSYQSIPLNKWTHVSAQLDMSSFTATTTTSYVTIDGIDAASIVSRGGTNPTALIQAGNLEIGSTNGGTSLFSGKIAQVAIYNAKVTQATIKASISQGLTGSETSLISAYSFNNTINDLNTTNANNLTANGSAVATSTDSPFNATEYAIVTANSFSTNTTLTVQVPEGYSLPTTGGIGTCYFSTQKVPYGFPIARGKWVIRSLWKIVLSQVTPVADTWYNLGSANITIPIGQWEVNLDFPASADRNTAGAVAVTSTFSTSSSAETNSAYTQNKEVAATGATGIQNFNANRTSDYEDISAATIYYALVRTRSSTVQTIYQLADRSAMKIDLVLSFL
jgi:hypothetical protein